MEVFTHADEADITGAVNQTGVTLTHSSAAEYRIDHHAIFTIQIAINYDIPNKKNIYFAFKKVMLF